MRKRIFSILLTIAVCLSMMPAGVWATDGETPGQGKNSEHSHCICGENTDVNGHSHNTGTTWTEATSLPTSAGNYCLTQSVTADWTVPTGEVNLCLNGQTINGKITVGSGRVQGEVTVNGGKFELYSGTITGGVQVGINGGSYQTGSAFTMYGGSISGNTATGGSGGGADAGGVLPAFPRTPPCSR